MKPCPFCGEINLLQTRFEGSVNVIGQRMIHAFVHCGACFMDGPKSSKFVMNQAITSALSLWDKRREV